MATRREAASMNVIALTSRNRSPQDRQRTWGGYLLRAALRALAAVSASRKSRLGRDGSAMSP